MAAPSVTYSFTNGTTSDASQVNTNFTDIINALTDGSADLTIGTLTANGAVTFKGNVTLGDASADDVTIAGSLASTITIKANATYNIGASTSGLAGLYLGYGANKTVKLAAGATTTSWTLTLPADVPAATGQGMIFDTSGNATWRYADKFTNAKTTNYNATGDETVILCDPTTGGASFTVTLPAAATMTGKSLTIIKVDSGLTYTVTIDGNASETILPSVQSGQLTYILYTQYESVTLKCNGTSWYVVAHHCATPWVNAGTITLSATTSAPTKGNTQTHDKFWWRRVGQNAHIRMNFRQTSGVGGAAGSGDLLLNVATYLGSIDTTYLDVYATVEGWNSAYQNSWSVGNATAHDGTSDFTGEVIVYDATYVRIAGQIANVQAGFLGSSFPALTGTNVTINADFIVPISGWNP